MGHVDPLKEVKAATERIANNISTQEQEASEYNGNDWLSNIRQRKKEMAAFNDMKPAAPAEPTEPTKPNEEGKQNAEQ